MQDPSFDYDVFLSFANADEQIVRPLWQELTRSGLRVFWSDASLRERAGTSWFEVIQESLGRSRHFLLIWTPASAASSWVNREYKAFFSHCYHAPTRLLIPILAGTRVDTLPLFLREVQACSFDEPNLLNRLIRLFGGVDIGALQEQLAQREEEILTIRRDRDDISVQLAELKARVSAGTVQQQEEMLALRRERDDLNTRLRDLATSSAVPVDVPERPTLSSESPSSESPKPLVVVRILLALFAVALAFWLKVSIAADESYGISSTLALWLGVACIAALALSWHKHPRAYLLLFLTAVTAASAAVWSNTFTINVPETGALRSLGYQAYFYRTACQVMAMSTVTLLIASRQIRHYFRVGYRRAVFFEAFGFKPPAA